MSFEVIAIPGIPIIQPGDNLATRLSAAIEAAGMDVCDGDVLVVCQKVFSKAEGRSVNLADIEPGPLARATASEAEDKDPRVAEVVLRNSNRIVMMKRGHMIVETGPGWVCANAGIDASNTGAADSVLLLPEDPDASARALAEALHSSTGARIGIIISDTWGRPWRVGLVDFAIGVSGINPLHDMRGKHDMDGRELHHTVHADADALAAAAGLLMGKDAGNPAVLIRGYQTSSRQGSGRDLIRDRETDLFR